MKPDFRQESRDGTLGNPAAEYVMDRLRPPYWFSAHMHCKFTAIKTYPPSSVTRASNTSAPPPQDPAVVASGDAGVQESNPDEIDLDMDDEETAVPSAQDGNNLEASDAPADTGNAVSDELRAQLPASFVQPKLQEKKIPGQPVPATITNTTVRFLALDKCLPGRKYLQVCDIEPADSEELARYPPASDAPRFKLQYDPEWLAITRALSKELRIGDRSAQTPPDLGEEQYLPLIETERAWVEQNVVQSGKLDVPDNFVITAPPHNPGDHESVNDQPDEYTNPQTEAFCALVGVPNLWDASETQRQELKRQGPAPETMSSRGGGFGGRGRGGHGRGGGR